MEDDERQEFLQGLNKNEKDRLRWHWDVWSRPQQQAPAGDWQTWLLLAGRGFGKTRAGAEWVREVARRHTDARIALVAASLGEARRVMVEGESGLLAISQPGRAPLFESSLRRLTWPNGAQAQIYSAAEAESLRGPQHSHFCGSGAKGDFRQRSTCAD
jgi:phage terminase large subunit-like protein